MILSLSNILGRSQTKEFSNSVGDFAYSRNNIKYWQDKKCGCRVQKLRGPVCESDILLLKTWVTTMETYEITPLHFTVRYFINILAKKINLVIHSWTFRAVLTNCSKLIFLSVLCSLGTVSFFSSETVICSVLIKWQVLIFIGTRKCKCMHVLRGINAVTVQIKATTFGHVHHHVNIVQLRFALHLSWRKVARGYPGFKITRISSMALLQNKSLFQALSQGWIS